MTKAQRFQQFQVFDRRGLIIAEGNERECAEQLGINYNTFHTILHRTKAHPLYRIVAVPGTMEKVPTPELAEAARKWDEFVTPIREAYGVPVYRPKKEKNR